MKQNNKELEIVFPSPKPKKRRAAERTRKPVVEVEDSTPASQGATWFTAIPFLMLLLALLAWGYWA